MKRHVSPIGLLATLVAALLVGSQAFAEVNLLTNPGFETGGGSYTGWFTFGSGVQLSLPGDDNIIRTGAAAAKTFGGFVGCPGNPQFNVPGFGQAFTPTLGNIYKLSGYSYVSSDDPIPGTDTCNKNRMIAKITFFNAVSGGSEIASNEIVIGDGNSLTNQWMPFLVSAPAPAGALRVEALFLYLQPACDGGAVYVDDTAFSSEAPTAEANLLTNPSFATNLSGWNTFGNVYYDGRAAFVRTPTGCAKLYSTFVNGSDSGMYQRFTATPGSGWKFSAYSLTSCRENPISGTNDNLALARIVFRDASNNDIGSSQTVIMDNTAPIGTWTQHTIRASNAPAGTVAVDAYILFVSPTLQGGAMWVDDVVFRPLGTTDVTPPPARAAFELHQNVPNPFNPVTRIDYELGQREVVDLGVYDVSGRLVVTLFHGTLEAGQHVAIWNGTTAAGTVAAAGVYRCKLTTSSGQMSRNMVLIK
jgi:hypothetical protein